MKRSIATLAVFAAAAAAHPAWAQYREPAVGQQGRVYQKQEHRIELLGYAGYLWSQSIDAYYQPVYYEADFKSGPIWGIEADVNVRPGGQLVLLYHRQDTELMIEGTGGTGSAGDAAIELWHVGGMTGFQRGNVMPFAMVTLGGARIVPEFAGGADDVWKFSLLLGAGAKFYVSDRVGLRVQARLPWIIVDGGGAIACGGGGCYTSVSGYGIAQLDVSGGLFIMF